jgi:hypothetical protein
MIKLEKQLLYKIKTIILNIGQPKLTPQKLERKLERYMEKEWGFEPEMEPSSLSLDSYFKLPYRSRVLRGLGAMALHPSGSEDL